MRIAYTTTFDARNVHHWSGTPYYMSNAFTKAECQLEYVGPLKRKLPFIFRLKQAYKKLLSDERLSPRFNMHAAKYYSKVTENIIAKMNPDIIISPRINPIAYLSTAKPIVLWTDALYAGLLGFYDSFAKHSAQTVHEANALTHACLDRCALLIFSSDWAANSAKELYGVDSKKIKVVPFGANFISKLNYADIHDIVLKRAKNKIKILFLAKSWKRKGGDIVLSVCEQLYRTGYPVELHIVGYSKEALGFTKDNAPPYLRCHGFISKHTESGQAAFSALLSEVHYLFVPSRAEAYGIVFCEANAFGVPCLTSHVGGIGTIIKDEINGKTFASNASIESYCDYIIENYHNPKRYLQLALSSYNEYVTRLNWNISVGKVKSLMQAL